MARVECVTVHVRVSQSSGGFEKLPVDVDVEETYLEGMRRGMEDCGDVDDMVDVLCGGKVVGNRKVR